MPLEPFTSAGIALSATAALTSAGMVAAYRHAQKIGLTNWLPAYLKSPRPAAINENEPIDLFLAVCDHYEPQWGRPQPADALARVNAWVENYPRLFSQFSDADGVAPQHTFFFPQDEYRPEYLDALAPLCRQGFGDFDIHLHHHHDTESGLREKLSTFRDALFDRHGLLRTDPETGRVVYGFIHGNWCLNNSRRDGQWCGVDHETPILLETGCYADFTMPSAPSDTQTTTINSIYHAVDRPGKNSHNTGTPAQAGHAPPAKSLLMIQGPLVPDFSRAKWGLIPKVENGDLLASHPPALRRLPQWLKAAVTLYGKPNWRFIKLHTHGCKPVNQQMWLSEQVVNFHRDLARFCAEQPQYRLHYVTAWEMALLVRLAQQFPQFSTNEQIHLMRQIARGGPWPAPASLASNQSSATTPSPSEFIGEAGLQLSASCS